MDKSLRIAVMKAAAAIGPISEFHHDDGSLSDFLNNHTTDVTLSQEVAAKLLEYFCLDESGSFNNFIPGLKLAFEFLRATSRSATFQDDAIRSLHELLMGGTDYDHLRRWAESYYP